MDQPVGVVGVGSAGQQVSLDPEPGTKFVALESDLNSGEGQ